MDNYIKLSSSQGVITAQQNILDFYIPSGGVYNLKDSYIELMCNAESVSAATVAGGIFSVGLRWQKLVFDGRIHLWRTQTLKRILLMLLLLKIVLWKVK
jgi:membrane protein CcdC involved in cytochrome C biogenesis